MKDFLSGTWQAVLSHNRLASFESLWSLDLPWFEPCNQRRGGWSGVARCELKDVQGRLHVAFLKRQENHNTFSWQHPLRGIPTFVREFRLIRRYQSAGIPALEPAYFAVRGNRAILMTEALEDYVPLDTLDSGKLSRHDRCGLLAAVANLTRKMHDAHLQHNCYYPKHVFVKVGVGGTVDAHVIDLEKSRWRPGRLLCALRDLDTLNRYAQGWSRADRMRFLKYYLLIDRMTPHAKLLWRRLAARAVKKRG
jgi:hypothetical protein